MASTGSTAPFMVIDTLMRSSGMPSKSSCDGRGRCQAVARAGRSAKPRSAGRQRLARAPHAAPIGPPRLPPWPTRTPPAGDGRGGSTAPPRPAPPSCPPQSPPPRPPCQRRRARAGGRCRTCGAEAGRAGRTRHIGAPSRRAGAAGTSTEAFESCRRAGGWSAAGQRGRARTHAVCCRRSARACTHPRCVGRSKATLTPCCPAARPLCAAPAGEQPWRVSRAAAEPACQRWAGGCWPRGALSSGAPGSRRWAPRQC